MLKKHKTLFYLFFLLSSLSLTAQTIQFENEEKKPIVNLKTLILDYNNNLLGIYYTDINGFLEQTPENGLDLKLTISHPNYGKQQIDIANFGDQSVYKFTLKKIPETLTEILITTKKAIRISGDTTFIDLKKFSTKTDRSLKDAIKRIPGMKIDKNGIIKYKERTVSDLLVNGNKLFDNEYSNATGIINPEKIIELAIIKNYQDQTGFENKDLNNTALDLKFNSETVFTGSLNSELGSSNVYSANFNSILSSNILSLYNNSRINNLGQVKFTGKRNFFVTNDRNTALQNIYELRYPIYRNSNLNEIYGTSHETKTINTNLNIPLNSGENKKEFLLLKLYNDWENITDNSQSRSILFDGSDNIVRNENTLQNIQYKGNNLYAEYKKKWAKYFIYSNVYFNKTEVSNRDNNNINGIQNNFSRKFENQLFSSNLKFEKNDNKERTSALTIDFFSNKNSDYNLSNGLTNFNQSINVDGHGFFTSFKSQLVKKSSFNVQLILDNKWNDYLFYVSDTGTNQIQESISEKINDTRTSIKFEFKKIKNVIIKSSISGYSFYLKNDNDRFRSLDLTYPSLEISYKKDRNRYKVFYENNIIRNTNRLRNNVLLYNNATNAIIQEAYNLPSRSDKLGYSYSYSNGINRWESNIDFSVNNDILLESFDITNNLSVLKIQNSKSKNKILNISNSYDFLFLRKWNANLQSNVSFGNSFQIFNNELIPSDYSVVQIDARISKRLGKRLFIDSSYQFQYNTFRLENNDSNSQVSSSFNIELDYNYRNYRANLEVISRNYGSDEYNVFTNILTSYEISRWKSNIKLRILNLFNIDDLTRKNSSLNSQYNYSQFIPGRRFSISYSFHF